jgi:large subunit ribosomal protein L6
MSRIGRKPVEIPKGVEARIGEETITIKGPLGELSQDIPKHVRVAEESGNLVVGTHEGAPSREGGAMQGLTRALLANMVEGVTKGYTKSLDLIGVGYRVKGQGQKISLALGFTEPVQIELPSDVKYEIKDTQGQKENQVILTGANKAVIGQIAADIRRLRPPEPYKGKGIRYTGERIRQKAGKAGAR